MKTRAYFTGVFFVICILAEALAFVGTSCEIPKGWVAMDTEKENQSDNIALFSLDVAAINIGQPFSFKVSLCGESETKLDRLTVNAIMPAHQHGMNYTPAVSYIDESDSFEVEGFLFHMPGIWVITVASYVGEDVTHYTKSIMTK